MTIDNKNKKIKKEGKKVSDIRKPSKAMNRTSKLIISLLCATILVACQKTDEKTNKEDVNRSKTEEVAKSEEELFQSEQTKAYEKQFVGKKAKSFTLSDTKGNVHSLEDFKGKNVVLQFATTSCPTCQHVQPIVHEWIKKQSDEVVWIEVFPIEPKETVETFLKRTNSKDDHVVLVFDQAKETTIPDKIIDMYKLDYVPTFLFIDKTGTIKAAHIGNINEYMLNKLKEKSFK